MDAISMVLAAALNIGPEAMPSMQCAVAVYNNAVACTLVVVLRPAKTTHLITWDSGDYNAARTAATPEHTLLPSCDVCMLCRAPYLFAAVLQQAGAGREVLPLLSDPARAAFQGLSITARHNRAFHTHPFLQVGPLCIPHHQAKHLVHG